eukprot:scaffold2047_cov129-Cylindrotheca_fusiformis.AAC.34
MAEFDAGGFSAFDQFFGETNDDPSSKKGKDPLVGTSSRKTKRGGVGADVPREKVKQDRISERLLRVGGSKRSREEDEEHSVEGNDDGDLEEEAGRTGIAPKVTKKKSESEKGEVPTKKLGKKERKRLQQEQETSKTNDAVEETTKDASAEESKKTRPKRRKVRSRQKNIRKDNRSTDEKPKHLQVGASDYKGRPLTEETRSRLSLPPSKSAIGGRSFVVDRTPVMVDDGGGGGVALGVEDLLEEEPIIKKTQKTTKKDRKGKKQRKYKNL